MATEQALYSGDLALVRQRYDDLKKHTLEYFFNPSLGLVSKPAGTMGAAVSCPASWSPAGMPPGIYEALHCSDARRDAGAKRVYPTETGFVMMRGRGAGGQAPDMEEDSEDKADPAEVLADYFHEAMSNLAWLATVVKI